jgi:hypothetical protein
MGRRQLSMTPNEPFSERRLLRGSDVGPTPGREISMTWVAAALTVVILAGAGIWFATSVGWDDSIPAGRIGWQQERATGCDRIVAAGQVWEPATDVGRTWQSVRGAPPVGRRLLVHHRLFYPATYALMADDGTRVSISPASICGTH